MLMAFMIAKRLIPEPFVDFGIAAFEALARYITTKGVADDANQRIYFCFRRRSFSRASRRMRCRPGFTPVSAETLLPTASAVTVPLALFPNQREVCNTAMRPSLVVNGRYQSDLSHGCLPSLSVSSAYASRGRKAVLLKLRVTRVIEGATIVNHRRRISQVYVRCKYPPKRPMQRYG